MALALNNVSKSTRINFQLIHKDTNYLEKCMYLKLNFSKGKDYPNFFHIAK